MKTKYQLILLGLLTLILMNPILASNKIDKTKLSKVDKGAGVIQPITGTWINLAYKDVRNKYTNPQNFDNNDSKVWEAKVRELSKMGIEYLVFMEVANEGKSYYPSQLMAWQYDASKKSPVDAIMDEASKNGMKVFLSTGWAKDQDDNLQDPLIKKRQLEIMEELAVIYKNHKAFYGWYLPVEDCLCPIFAEHAVQSVNSLTEKANVLTPGKKTLISPYGIGLSEFSHPDFEKQMSKIKVDIIAYQDEVGCVRDQFTLPRLKSNWKKMREIHDKLDIEMWANCETFTWEEGTNDRASALIPGAYSRLLSQQVAASDAGVDKIISFMFPGIIEDPESPYQLGQPVWSNKVYNDYMAWRNSDKFWKLMEASFSGDLKNEVINVVVSNSSHDFLFDHKVGEENATDERWVAFEKGNHELLFDLNEKKSLNDLFLRILNYDINKIGSPLKVYLYASVDGINYNLLSIKDAPYFPNNKHDAWVDGILFESIKEEVRYLKLAFDAPQKVYVDEVFINPYVVE